MSQRNLKNPTETKLSDMPPWKAGITFSSWQVSQVSNQPRPAVEIQNQAWRNRAIATSRDNYGMKGVPLGGKVRT